MPGNDVLSPAPREAARFVGPRAEEGSAAGEAVEVTQRVCPWPPGVGTTSAGFTAGHTRRVLIKPPLSAAGDSTPLKPAPEVLRGPGEVRPDQVASTTHREPGLADSPCQQGVGPQPPAEMKGVFLGLGTRWPEGNSRVSVPVRTTPALSPTPPSSRHGQAGDSDGQLVGEEEFDS